MHQQQAILQAASRLLQQVLLGAEKASSCQQSRQPAAQGPQ